METNGAVAVQNKIKISLEAEANNAHLLTNAYLGDLMILSTYLQIKKLFRNGF